MGRRERGTAMVEMAIVLQLLLMLTLGAIQYGWFFWSLHHATNAARQGARVACALGATPAEGVTASQYALGGHFGIGATVTPASRVVDGVDYMEFTVDIDINKARLLNVTFLPTPNYCRARVVMAKEGAP